MLRPDDVRSIKKDIALIFQSCENLKDVENMNATFINHISLFKQYKLIDDDTETVLKHHVNVWTERAKYQFNYWGK